MFSELPEAVAAVITDSQFVEFATLTATGEPLDTPLLGFADPARGTIDMTTGLSYPIKAERARRNPKVGLFFDGTGEAGSPMVSVSALVAVRDADIQTNAERYVRASKSMLPWISFGCSPEEARAAVWYWSRIWLECTPARVRWWQSLAAADAPPEEWTATPPVSAPVSDPAPKGTMSPAPRWFEADWRARAAAVLAVAPSPHLTLVDGDGFPLPFRTRDAELVDRGFRVDVPRGHPWPALQGPASLAFGILGIFVGTVQPVDERHALFVVDRILPDHPLVANPREIFAPEPATRRALTERLERELARRGQPMPELSPELFG